MVIRQRAPPVVRISRLQPDSRVLMSRVTSLVGAHRCPILIKDYISIAHEPSGMFGTSECASTLVFDSFLPAASRASSQHREIDKLPGPKPRTASPSPPKPRSPQSPRNSKYKLESKP